MQARTAEFYGDEALLRDSAKMGDLLTQAEMMGGIEFRLLPSAAPEVSRTASELSSLPPTPSDLADAGLEADMGRMRSASYGKRRRKPRSESYEKKIVAKTNMFTATARMVSVGKGLRNFAATQTASTLRAAGTLGVSWAAQSGACASRWTPRVHAQTRKRTNAQN